MESSISSSLLHGTSQSTPIPSASVNSLLASPPHRFKTTLDSDLDDGLQNFETEAKKKIRSSQALTESPSWHDFPSFRAPFHAQCCTATALRALFLKALARSQRQRRSMMPPRSQICRDGSSPPSPPQGVDITRLWGPSGTVLEGG